MATGARVLLAASAASAVVAGLLAVPVQAAAPEAGVPSAPEGHAAPAGAAAARSAALPARAAARKRVSWAWIDGSLARRVQFDQEDWEDRTGDMGLVVRVAPANPRSKAVLKYKQDGTWRKESAAWTRRGRAQLLVSPWCDSPSTWCTGTWPYRLLVDGRIVATLVVGFQAAEPAPTPTPTTPAPVPTTPTPAPSTSTPTPTASPTRVPTGNLIANPGAEAGPAGGDRQPPVEIPGWTRRWWEDGATVYAYDAPLWEGGLTSSSPGPEDRGSKYFAGGYRDWISDLYQTIPLDDYVDAIDAGGVGFELSAWLGGFSTRSDWASAKVEFLDADGSLINHSSVFSPDPEERGDVTGLWYRRTPDGVRVPTGTRSARVTLHFEEPHDTGPQNHGCADNVFLQLLV